MSRLMFYLHYALRSLRRDGTRSLLALLSVAVGVLSLIAMQLLANALLHGSMFDQRIQYGGDAQIIAEDSRQGFTASDLEQFEAWRQDGLIAAYTPISWGSASYLRTPANGRAVFISRAMGIDPATYPLVGELVLREPAGATAADVLQNPTDVMITRDLAAEQNLHIGDTILLAGEGTPTLLTVAGIIAATPTQQGDSVFYSLETARLIENREAVVTTIPVVWGSVPDAPQTLIDSPYQVYVARERADAVQDSSSLSLFDIMLKGAGVLGLLVGGISVANTLQVILARRKLEIAMLKTLGYRRFDLLMLISLETGLIGLVGGIIGAWAGAQVAGGLLDILSRSGSLMLDWSPDPVIVFGGVIVGILTAVVFGMQAILVSSATRPVQILRDLPQPPSQRMQLGRFGLYVAMLLIFGVLVGVVLGTPLEGILYMVVGGFVIVVLRAVFWSLLWLALKLPMPPFPILRLARSNLRQRKAQASLAVIALFAGAFSVTFAALVIYNAQATVTRVRPSDEGFNLMAFTDSERAQDAVNHMILQGAQATYVTERVQGTVNGGAMIIEGRDAASLTPDLQYSGDWPEAGEVALLPSYEASLYNIGQELTLRVGDQQQTVTLVGYYSVNWDSLSPQSGQIIVPRRLAQTFGQHQARVMGQFPAETLREVTITLGQALPEVLFLSRADLNDAMVATYQSLFTFAVAIAGLAFVAGAVLIANAAGLTVVERRREIGVFKAVGYTSGLVLRALLSEYGFLGMFAGLFGIIGAVAAITMINLSQPAAQMSIEPMIVGGMLLFSVVIAVLSAAVVAWQPTQVRPLDVLRYE